MIQPLDLKFRAAGLRSCLYLFLFSLLFISAPHPAAFADSIKDSTLKHVFVKKILIEGNKKTKPQIITRQLTFSEGDSVLLDELMTEMEQSKNQLLNIGLFNEVSVNVKNWESDSVEILVTVKERWYIFPIPSIDLYDRNFTVWWVEHKRDLKWIQYGIRYYHQNMRGRDEDLKLVALFGYQQRFEFQYHIPFLDRKQQVGLRTTVSFNQAKNINYTTIDNKELIYQNPDVFQRRNFFSLAEVIYQPRFYNRYVLALGYNSTHISDTIARMNPDYFVDSSTTQQYLSARVSFVSDHRDLTSYPLHGSFTELSVTKFGLGLFDDVNLLSTQAFYSRYFSLGKKWYLSSSNKIKFSFPKEQPYNLQRGLGYRSDYISGYEHYLIDGQSFVFTKLNLKNEIFNIKIPTSKKNPLLKGADIPFALYGRVYFDAGYVHDDLFDESNSLRNTLLLGTGVAADIVLLYDTVLRLEYSVNHLGEHGLYFHLSSFL